MSDGLASKLRIEVAELTAENAALRLQNRELVTEIKIRDGVISELQNRLAAHEKP